MIIVSRPSHTLAPTPTHALRRGSRTVKNHDGLTAPHPAPERLDKDRRLIAQWMVDGGLMVHEVVFEWGVQEY
ncbi:hypothetical protein BDW68DRAFT_172401, partial [Aspergillus falconensis]